jgi:hypothetical protein
LDHVKIYDQLTNLSNLFQKPLSEIKKFLLNPFCHDQISFHSQELGKVIDDKYCAHVFKQMNLSTSIFELGKLR